MAVADGAAFYVFMFEDLIFTDKLTDVTGDGQETAQKHVMMLNQRKKKKEKQEAGSQAGGWVAHGQTDGQTGKVLPPQSPGGGKAWWGTSNKI